MNLAGYDHEIFVLASKVITKDLGVSTERIKLSFYNTDGNHDELGISRTIKTKTRMPIPNKIQIASLAAGDFDGDGQNNDLALLSATKTNMQLFVFKLVLNDDDTLSLKMLGNAAGYDIFSTQIGSVFNDNAINQACAEVIMGDFDGDGKDEIAAVYKDDINDTAAKTDDIVMGKVNVLIYKWDDQQSNFTSGRGSISYNYYQYHNALNYKEWAGVAGLRAVPADIDGDGKDEIVTLVVGYYERYDWYHNVLGGGSGYDDEFWYYPYLTVWSCKRGTITPAHDSDHIKGKGIKAELLKDKASANELVGSYVWHYKKNFSSNIGHAYTEGQTHPEYIYAPQMFSLAAGPFTGTMGSVTTVDDIVLTTSEGWINLYLFKTNIRTMPLTVSQMQGLSPHQHHAAINQLHFLMTAQ